MVTSPKFSHARHFFEFSKAYFIFSVLFTLILVVLAYKDIISLRYNSAFFTSSTQSSASVDQLLLDGFSNNLLVRIADFIPMAAFILLSIIVAYSAYSAFQGTYHGLNINKHYINNKKVSSSQIILQYAVLSATAFTIPLLFWCFYLSLWFPYIAKLPLRYILHTSPAPLLAMSLLILVILCLLTHSGVVMSRLAMRLFKYE